MFDLNLLPLWIRQRKRRQRMIFILMAAQVAVILLLWGTVYAVRAVENKERQRSALLSSQLAAMDSDTLGTAEEAVYFSDAFKPEWLAAILENVPQGVHILHIDYTGVEIIITANADELTDIGVHQVWLGETEHFEPVLLGQITRTDDGRVRYTLRLGVGP
jgi:Tfp pilus assembly protein PilN